MGLGLTFSGRLAPRGLLRRKLTFDAWTRELLQAFEAVHTGFVESAQLPQEGSNSATVQLHPAAEPVFIEREPEGRIRVSARTSGIGAGYHLQLLDTLLPFFERSGFEIDDDPEASLDECGVWPAGERNNAAREMLAWRRGVAERCLEIVADGGDQLALSMPTEHSFTTPGAVLTPLGPRDREWLEALAHGRDDGAALEAWSEPGLGARYWRGRALTRMWCDVRWRAPLDEREDQLLNHVHRELLAAFKADPSLPLPVREWRELAGFARDRLEVPARAVALSESEPIGYRRRPVLHRFASWRFTAPGEFASELEDNGRTLHLRDATRSLRFSALTYSRSDDSPVAAAQILEREVPPQATQIEVDLGPDVLSHAYVGPDGDARVLQGVAAVDGCEACMTLAYTDVRDDAWATSVFASLRRGN